MLCTSLPQSNRVFQVIIPKQCEEVPKGRHTSGFFWKNFSGRQKSKQDPNKTVPTGDPGRQRGHMFGGWYSTNNRKKYRLPRMLGVEFLVWLVGTSGSGRLAYIYIHIYVYNVQNKYITIPIRAWHTLTCKNPLKSMPWVRLNNLSCSVTLEKKGTLGARTNFRGAATPKKSRKKNWCH